MCRHVVGENPMRRILLWAAPCALILSGCSQEEPVLEGPFQVPPGFVVESVADPEIVGSLVQFTFDSLGRPVVSKERDHPTLLLDSDGDGFFETEKIYSDKVSNLQGMWFDGRTFYAVGDNAEGKAGLYKLEDANGDDVADSIETITQFTGPMGEHGPHDIRRGPDGRPTILLGNHTFVPAEQIEAESPLTNYRESQLLQRYMDARGHAVNRMAPGGSLFRVGLEDKTFALLLGGFRNPYSHAYNAAGEAFTFDSDMEWDINLPWYRDVRSVHGIPGGDFGWRTGSGKFPAYYLDSLPPVDDLGRGSPVGVDFYHHYAYPKEYFDAFIQGDWSRGRVVLSRFKPSGATYELAEPASDFIYGEPLNVTDVEVGPDGFLYFTMGGRKTQGGFYRVAYKGRRANWDALPAEGVMAAVRQPQPLSSWGHAALLKKQEEMGESWGPELQAIARDASAASNDRVRALFLLQRSAPKPNAELLGALLDDADPAVRAASVYVVGQHGSDRAKALAARGLKDSDPLVQRRAAEALVRMGLSADEPSFAPVADVYALLNSPDRFVRWAGRQALERIAREEWKGLVETERNIAAAPAGMLALIRTASSDVEVEPAFENTLSMLKAPNLQADDELRLLRVFQLACIEVESGCRESLRNQIYDVVADRFPSDDERLNREYARTLSYSGRHEAIGEILAAMPTGEEDQQLQIHYAYCLRAIKQGWTKEQKETLLSWFSKAREWRGGASFPGFINRMFDSSLEFFDEDEKKRAYAAIPEFAPVEDAAAAGLSRGNYQRAQVFARKRGVEGVSEQEILEFLMYDPMTTLADPHEGKKIFDDQCAKCHRFGGEGRDKGPDLTTLSNRFSRRDMVDAVLWPSKIISDQYESWRIERGNEVFLGLIMEQDDDEITVLLPEEERPVIFKRSDITDLRRSELSIMPDGMLDGYGMRSIATLFAYLQQGPDLPPQEDSE